MIKTYKFRLYPTKNQTQKLEQILETCRRLYNSCLSDKKNHYKETGKSLSRIEQQITLKENKKQNEFLQNVYSQVLQEVLFRLDKSFQNFFRRIKSGEKPGYPRFKSLNRYHSICYPQQPGFQLTEQGLKLSKIGTVKIKLHRPIKGNIKTCIVKRTINKWYACFSVEYISIPKPITEYKPIGIDVGIKSYAILSNGTKIENPKHLKQSEHRLKRTHRLLSRKKKGSNNRGKARIILAKLYLKIANQRSDFLHKLSRFFVNNYSFIAIENLTIRNMVKNHRLAKSISDCAWGQFFFYLQYKEEETGSVVEKVNPQNTTINCSNCGQPVNKTLADRIHFCPFCLIKIDRDHNAAINILQKSTAGTAGSNAWGESVRLQVEATLTEPRSPILSPIG